MAAQTNSPASSILQLTCLIDVTGVIRWKPGDLLGIGSFGRVILGFNSDTGHYMAVKQVSFSQGMAGKLGSADVNHFAERRRKPQKPERHICLFFGGGWGILAVLCQSTINLMPASKAWTRKIRPSARACAPVGRVFCAISVLWGRSIVGC